MSNSIRTERLPRAADAKAAQRIYRTLLLAYPRAFRSEFGEEMTQVFAAAYRDVVRHEVAPPSLLLRFWCVILVDLVVAATAERLKEGLHMSQPNVVRLGGVALLIGGVLQIALLAAQATITLDFAVAFTAPTGSPWIGRGEVALSLAPALASLLGLLGLPALGHKRAGAAGMVAIMLITAGLVAQAVAGTLTSALSWGNLGACISARDCNIYDGTGMFWQAIAVLNLGNLIATLGLLLYGIVTLRSRLLLRGNSLPLLLVAASALPYFIVRIALTLGPSPDAAGDIRLDSVLMAGSLAVATVSFLLGRAILCAVPPLPPAAGAPAPADAAPA